MDIAPSILNFDAGISRVLWHAPPQAGELPDRLQLAPSKEPATLKVNDLVVADNIETALGRSLQPAVASPDILRPDKFEGALQAFDRQLERVLPDAQGDDRQALEGLDKVLKERGELREIFHFYRDMLIAG